jgi:septal ring factor EnvC (AmiA/AmiB activator)
MDFKDFFIYLKEIISPDIVAFCAIIYFAFIKIFKFMAKLLGFANEWEDTKKTKEDIKNIKEDIKKVIEISGNTQKELHEVKNDVNAYKKRTHKIENQDIVLKKIVEENTAIMQKINNKL